jgi:hypothetical protein
MQNAQPTHAPSPQEMIKKLEAYQRCHGLYLHDPSLNADYRVDLLIPHIRHYEDTSSAGFLNRVEELLARYDGSSVQAQFEQQLSEHLQREVPVANDLVEGLCSAIPLQTPVHIELARAVAESPVLTSSDFAVISDRFFSACAPFLAHGVNTAPDHFSHSFLQVALLAKSKQLTSCMSGQ